MNMVAAGVSTEACISPNFTQVCSDRGDCVSGVCSCHPRGSNADQKYSGQYCQCDDYSCPYHDGLLCGGHGQCVCGQCQCDQGYTSDNCGCPTSTETCLTENFNSVCNNWGTCECGRCRCKLETIKGPTCEESDTISALKGKCTVINRSCAMCVGFNKTFWWVPTEEECRSKCTNVAVVDVIDQDELNANENMFLCSYLDEEERCEYFYAYEYLNYRNITIQVQKQKKCPGDNSGNGATPLKILLLAVLGTMFI